jgi:RNA polymerase sigma-54 factor
VSMFQRQAQTQRLQQRADPQLLQTSRLLQMSSMELAQYVSQELDENPALVSADEQRCGHCDIPRPECAGCPFNPLLRAPRGGDDRLRGVAIGSTAPGAEEDLFAGIAAPQTLREHLVAQLGWIEDAIERRVGLYLIDCIDEDGFLRVTDEEVGRNLEVPVLLVQRLVARIQTMDPPGIGARGLQESLLIQARALSGELGTPAHLEPLLTHGWKELASGKWGLIARRLRVPERDVEQTVAWLRQNLTPHPGQAYRASWDQSAHRRGAAVCPDILVSLDENDRVQLDLVDGELPQVSVSAQYARLGQQMQEQPAQFGEGEREHVRAYLSRAQMFLKSLEDRTTLLRKVAEFLVDEQEAYLRSECDADMRPLTRAELAAFAQVHESTISRAVREKFVQLPSGSVVPMSHFFDRALSHRKLVANVIAGEDSTAPYSDQEIADLLRRQGVTIARRTVLKYREEMNILSSRQRAGRRRIASPRSAAVSVRASQR